MLCKGSWFRQPTTMIGLAMIVLTGSLAAVGLVPVSAFVCALVPAFGLIGVTDNTGGTDDLKRLLVDAVTAEATGTLRANLPKLFQEAATVATDVTKRAAMLILVLLAAGALTACAVTAGAPAASTSRVAMSPAAATGIACAGDAILQPIGAELLTTLVPEAAAGVSIDSLVVHPAIVKLCAGMNAKPVAVPATPAAVAPNAGASAPAQVVDPPPAVQAPVAAVAPASGGRNRLAFLGAPRAPPDRPISTPV